MLLSRRNGNLLAAVVCFAFIAVAYFYFEKTQYLIPCPLCYAQRIMFALLGFFFLLAAIFSSSRALSWLHGLWLLVLALGGAALSIRHLYLQNLPEGNLPACGQDFYALLENSPMLNVIRTMLTGSGDCGEVHWVFLGLSISGWALVAFIGLGIWAFFHNIFRS